MPDHPTCNTCRWWEGFGRGVQIQGCCRRLPPRVVVVPTRADAFEELAQMRTPLQAETEFQTMWPTTQAGDWCGEHQPKERA